MLASACFVGATCSCSLLQGQQLVPQKNPVSKPPVQEFVEASEIKVALKPLIPAKQIDLPLKPLKPSPKQPAVPVAAPVKSNLAEVMPPAVTAVTTQEQTSETAPAATAPVLAAQMPSEPEVKSAVLKGKNFPIFKLFFQVSSNVKVRKVSEIKITEIQLMSDKLKNVACDVKNGPLIIVPDVRGTPLSKNKK